ncbi:exodeoxyribonuclease protein [Rhizobium phage RHph_Y65]|uniref:Exodeoxyribonuclease protein n=1 Tax=Rhizobium phage RHph_Y65 TaxID=2509785 RepID=A0A7S5RC27_9CAUD|nr:exonuclease [Rhizobium phage RHph_Y65]QIG72751.1 exodeoxyribonuclease protein [Rhizobium phage RHph_Y65]
MNHIMLDFETLDTKPSAVVMSVGIVAFDPLANDTIETLRNDPHRKLYLNLQFDDQIKNGRTISEDTIRWWFEDKLAEARSKLKSTDLVSTPLALTLIDNFILKHDIRYSWGNGSDFDNAIYDDLHRTFNRLNRIKYKNKRCARTIFGMTNKKYNPKDFNILEHDAIEDCYFQILRLQDMFRNHLTGIDFS